MKKIITFLVLLTGVSTHTLAQLSPIPPQPTNEEVFPAEVAQPSRICIPVRLPIPYLRTFEQNLCEYMAGRYRDADIILPLPLTYYVDLNYQVWRAAPLDELRLHGDTFSIQEKLYYTADGKVIINSVIPISGQCGWDDEAVREVSIGFDSKINFDSNYCLATKTIPRDVVMLNRCELTVTNKDVTENLKHLIEKIQNLAKDKVDAIVPSLTSFKTPVQHLWEVLQKPIKIDDQTWLSLELSKFSGGRILVSEGTPQWVSTTLGVTFTPKIYYGTTHPTAQDTLPKLSLEDCQQGFEVHPEINFSFAQLDSTLNDLSAGSSNQFIQGRRKLSITKFETYNSGQQVVVKAQVELRAARPQNARHPILSRLFYFFDNFFYRKKGALYLTGTPSVAVDNNTVELKDFKYDDATEAVLQRKAAWVMRTCFLSTAKKRTVYSIAPALNNIKSALRTGLTITADKFRLSVRDNIITQPEVFIYKKRIYARFDISIEVKGDYDTTY